MAAAEPPVVRVLEFYSGIGGLRYSLEYAGVSAAVVEAFDINEVANDVYEHNFGHRPNQGNIQRLTVQQLDKYKADAWLLSPPCQPYTRQGLQKDVEDGRATSFLQLLLLLARMSSPPSYVFVENVVGFECSVTRGRLRDALAQAEFEAQEFILSPLQFGIPYSRPRYFCLAKRKPLLFRHHELSGILLRGLGPLQAGNLETGEVQVCSQSQYKPEVQSRSMDDLEIESSIICYPISKYIEAEPSNYGIPDRPVLDSAISNTSSPPEQWNDFLVPVSTITRWGDVFDIVTPESKRCCCFTKSYTRFAKGTGSFLAMETSDSDLKNFKLQGVSLQDFRLRYFTPREVANLHSFPTTFSFPEHVTLKQRYALLGNSLSVAVVGHLLRYLFQTHSAST